MEAPGDGPHYTVEQRVIKMMDPHDRTRDKAREIVHRAITELIPGLSLDVSSTAAGRAVARLGHMLLGREPGVPGEEPTSACHEPNDWCPPRTELGEGRWPFLIRHIPPHAGNFVVVEAVRHEMVRMLSELPDRADIMVTFAIDRKSGGVYSMGWTQDRTVRLTDPPNEFLGRIDALRQDLELRLLDTQLDVDEEAVARDLYGKDDS